MPYKSYAEFARTKGARDKGKRKSRGGAIAAGVAGAGALGAGVRYGGAEIATRGAMARRGQMMPIDKIAKKGGSRVQRNVRASESGGAVGQLRRDMEAIGNSKPSQFLKNKATAVKESKLGKGVASRYGALKESLTKGRGGNKLVGKTLGGRLARGGAGLLLAGGGTAAVLNYLKNRKKNKK